MHLQSGTLVAHLETMQHPSRVPVTMHLQSGTLVAHLETLVAPSQRTCAPAFVFMAHGSQTKHEYQGQCIHTNTLGMPTLDTGHTQNIPAPGAV
jgi:hypothetical protein